MDSDNNTLAPYHGSEPFIFVSYSHRNAGLASEIIHRMMNAGFRVWYDEGLIPGREWDDNIARIIMASSYFVALVSREYLASSNCKDELNFARDKNKPILLIYLDDSQLPAGMELRLGRLFAVHRSQYSSEKAFYAKVFSAEGLARCNRRYVPSASRPAASGRTASSSPTASSSRSSSSSSAAAKEDRVRGGSDKARVTPEPASSGSGLQVFGVILLLVLLAGAAILLYHLFGSGSSLPAVPPTPPMQTVVPSASTEAELDIEATPTPTPEASAAVPTPETVLTPDTVPTPTMTPVPTLPPTFEPTPPPTLPPMPTPTPYIPPEEVTTPTPDPTVIPEVDPGSTGELQIVDPTPTQEPENYVILVPDASTGEALTVTTSP